MSKRILAEMEAEARDIHHLMTVTDVTKRLAAVESSIELRQTCGACPEAYDAYVGDKQVGYLRLRHGLFSVRCPDSDGERVHVAEPDGDGIFTDTEREEHLSNARAAIADWMRKQP